MVFLCLLIYIDTMIGAVEVDRDWVRFLSLYGRDMIRKAKTKFGLIYMLCSLL